MEHIEKLDGLRRVMIATATNTIDGDRILPFTEAGVLALERQPTLLKLLEKAAEEIENCYGRETELSERIRQQLN